MTNILKNAIAKAKRQMLQFEGTTTILDIAYGLEYEYGLDENEFKVLVEKMKKYNEKECCGIYK